MGNDAACKTAGIDSIHTKMFDGHVRTFKDVRQFQTEEKPSPVGSLESIGM